MNKLFYLFIGVWALLSAHTSYAQDFDFSCETCETRTVIIETGLLYDNESSAHHLKPIIAVEFEYNTLGRASGALAFNGEYVFFGARLTGYLVRRDGEPGQVIAVNLNANECGEIHVDNSFPETTTN